MTPNRKEIISLLRALENYCFEPPSRTTLPRIVVAKSFPIAVWPVITSTMSLLNSLFCSCRYVEYWCLDLNFGQHTTQTEMGAELKGIDTIEKFVDFLYSKRGEYMATFDADNPNPYQLG